MTTLLELKQKVKFFFGTNQVFFMPILKFAIAFLHFIWLSESMGYFPMLNNLPFLAVLAGICCILPSQVTVLCSFVLLILHSYAVGLECAGFMIVLILLLAIFFLRFSGGTSFITVLTPISFSVGFPVMLPIGSGLLLPASSAIPAACGVVLYYFIRYLNAHASELSNVDIEPVAKLQTMADGIIYNWGMWITVVTFIAVILMVNLIRTRSFDYAWRVSIIVGGVLYVVLMMTGSYYLNATVDVSYLITSTVIAVVVGIVIEFFFFGGDYSRTERLEYEDDEYYYYVKAVPKASVSTAKRRIKKIHVEDLPQSGRSGEVFKPYAHPLFSSDDPEADLNLEKKLEESLRDL